MKRRLFNAAAVVSLTLCLATIVFWVRSYWWKDTLGYARVSLDSSEGSIRLIRQDRGGGGFYVGSDPVEDRAPLLEGLTGFHHYTIDITFIQPARRVHAWIFPHWCLALAAAALPVGRLILERRASRTPKHACPSCGYDLRGTPGTSGGGSECPECGAASKAG